MILALSVPCPPNRANAPPSSFGGLYRPGNAENRRATLRHGKPGRLNLNPVLFNRPYLLRARSLPLHGSMPIHYTGRQQTQGEIGMPKGEQKGNREKKKPKKEKIKSIAAAPSQKSVGSLQSGFGNKK
jgi:hypothetical protein